MAKLLFYHFPVTNLKLKNKKFHFELLTQNRKIENFTSSFELDRHTFIFHFQVTNSKLKNKKVYFELLIQNAKEHNLDFKVAQVFFIEMKYYKVQNYLKKCRHVGFYDFRYRSCFQ